MNCELKIKGAPSLEELKASPAFPTPEHLRRGPIAVIECIEEIPCNPCEAACPMHAIHIGNPITSLPRLDAEKCIGCGKCIAACSGLAIYVKDYTYSKDTCTISFPFEYLPLPVVGAEVEMVGRHGEVYCKGIVLKVNNAKSNGNTAVVTAAYPKLYFEEVISIKRSTRG
ncbi:MAG TPA: 4Fe-4S dicluster domain-containing protein [Clostridia bacterium]|nr:4Fe-4S dicluster domain-containing protein [Clostridia bacterium]